MTVELVPADFDVSEVMALISRELPSGVQDLPVTKHFINVGIKTVFVKAQFVQQAVMKEMVRRVISYTPRKTGHLRYNWQVQINGTNNNELFVQSKSYDDTVPYEKARGVINKWKLGKDVRLFNNASYAYKAETTGWQGTSNYHPPYGMLKKVIAGFTSIFNEVVAGLQGSKK